MLAVGERLRRERKVRPHLVGGIKIGLIVRFAGIHVAALRDHSTLGSEAGGSHRASRAPGMKI